MDDHPVRRIGGLAAKMPRAKCKIIQDCSLCPNRIRAGMRMGKDFSSNEWVHLGCLIRKINANKIRKINTNDVTAASRDEHPWVGEQEGTGL